MNKKLQKNIIIGVLIVLILGISVIYATLTTKLKIIGHAAIANAHWDIHFDNLKRLQKSDGVTIVTESLSTTTFSLSLSLEKPGDKVIYTFDVVNGGTIDAKISKINLPEDLNGSFINYEFTYEDGTEVKVGDELKAGTDSSQGETKNLKLVVTYDAKTTAGQLNPVSIEYPLTVTILYVQA